MATPCDVLLISINFVTGKNNIGKFPSVYAHLRAEFTKLIKILIKIIKQIEISNTAYFIIYQAEY